MRIDQLTFTRFIAAIGIVCFHFSRNVFPFQQPFLHQITQNLNVGVSYFYVISGFVMIVAYGKLKKIPVWKYYTARIARVFPAFFVSLVILLVYIMWIHGTINTVGLILQFFLLQAWVRRYQLVLNSPAWSLSVEIFFYFLFPFLYNYLYRKAKKKSLILLFVIGWAMSQYIFVYVQLKVYPGPEIVKYSLYFPLLHVNEFIAGNLLGLWFADKLTIKFNSDLLIILMVGLLILSMYFIHPYIIFHNGLMAPVFCVLIYLIAVNNGKIAKIFSWPFFILLGDISYGIYIYQNPVFKTGNYIFLKVLHFSSSTIIFYINTLLLILFSWISFKVIETPVMNFIKRRFGRTYQLKSEREI